MNKISKKNLTILYVEDEDVIRKEISIILGFIASKVVVARDGEEGIKKFEENKIDLIITDVNMPKLNGFEMLRAIRKQSQVPAIILSAFSQPDFIKQANQIDIVNEYLLKPVDITILFDKINKNYEKIEKQREYQEVSRLLEQYKIAVDKSAIVSKSDINGKITYANEQFCKISGYNIEELIGNSHNIVRHSNNSKAFFEDLWNTIKVEKRIWNGRFKNRAKDGTTYVVDATIVPILNTLNEIEEFIAIRFDVTEVEAYKEFLQEKLHSSQEDVQKKMHLVKEYEHMINLSASVIRVDINKQITFANDRILQLLNYKEEELLKKELISIMDRSSFETYNKIFNEVIEKNFWQGVLKLSCNNQIYFMDFTFRTIKDIEGNIIEFMGIGKNITETINLYKEIEDTQKDVIFSLGTIGEARSKETGNHVKRVAEYSYLLAKKVGLSEEAAELIKMASPMHDIGKVGIPDAILNKPAKFTPEEFEQMKNHAKIGYDMLKNSNREILKASSIIAYEHHEKWDGTGYPRALKAEEIHIYGRITAIADVFDALGSDRCYKKAWPLDRILQLFKDEKAKHFDPKLIDIFFENLEEFLEIKEKYKDEFDELEVYR